MFIRRCELNGNIFSGRLAAPLFYRDVRSKYIFVKIEVFSFVLRLINPTQPSNSFHIEPSRLI